MYPGIAIICHNCVATDHGPEGDGMDDGMAAKEVDLVVVADL